MHERRVAALQERLAEAGLAALVLGPGANFRYFFGANLHYSERVILAVVPARGEPAVVVPAFEADRIGPEVAPAELFRWEESEGPAGAVARALARVPTGGDVALEYYGLRVIEFDLLRRALPGRRDRDGTPWLAALRMVKDAAEVDAMTRAAAIADAALADVRPLIGPGRRESELREAVEQALLEHHSERPVGCLVASGPRSAVPHGQPGDRELAPGDAVWLDFGGRVDGYSSDLTRTFLLAPVPAPLAEVYQVVERAQQMGRQGARPGLTAAAVDSLCRDAITAAGWGPEFTHRTGHGLGLEGHEHPYIVQGNDLVLTAGMTFTIEPGVYVPDLGGVRIEDDVILTATGCRSLTASPRDLAAATVG